MPRLSRLKVGRDVPWVTSWSAEAMLGMRPCPTVNGALAAWQEERPGEGRPLYSQNHARRQRLSVGSMLCPMCGAPTVDGDRWSQTGRYVTAGELRTRGLARALPAALPDTARILDAGAIAPLHRACAEAALTHCPHLGGMADHTLKPFPPNWVVFPLTVPAAPLHALAVRPPPPAVLFLQLFGLCDDPAALVPELRK